MKQTTIKFILCIDFLVTAKATLIKHKRGKNKGKSSNELKNKTNFPLTFLVVLPWLFIK